MNNSKKIKLNFIYKLIYQITAILVPLVTTPYLARVLGATELGNYGYAYSIMIYFGLFAVFGFNIYGRREIAKVRDDKISYSKCFFEIVIAKAIPSTLAIFSFIVFAIFYREYSIILFALLPNLLYHLFDFSFAIQGEENFQFITFRELGVKLTTVILIFLLIKKPTDVWIYALIISSSTLISAFAMIPYFIRRLERIPLKTLLIWPHLKKSIVFLIPAFASSVFLFIDKIMIKLISGSSDQVAFYEESIKIVTMLTGITTALANVIEPRNANEIAKGNLEGAKENTIKGIKYSMLLCLPMSVGVVAISGIFCPIFFGDGFEPVIPILQMMGILIPIISLNELLGTTFVIATNREKTYSIIILICAGVNILLNFIFIYFFSAFGAAIGTVTSELIKTIILIIYLRKELDFLNVLKDLTTKILACVGMALFVIPMSFIAEASIFALIIILITGVISYLSFVFILKDNEFNNLVSNLYSKARMLFPSRKNGERN